MVRAGVMPSISANDQNPSHVASQVISFVVVSSIRDPIECITKEDLRLDWCAMRNMARSVQKLKRPTPSR
jgi:hypothetical protein